MEKSNQKVYSRRLTLILIWGPIIGIPLVIISFALINTFLRAGADFPSSTVSFRQLALTIGNFVLGLLGLVSVVGLFTALPYGIYRLKKGTSAGSKSEVVTTEDRMKFIENTPFSPIDGLFKVIMILNGIQVLGNLYIIVPMVLIYQSLTKPNSLSVDSQNFVANFNYDAYSNWVMVLGLLCAVIFLVWFNKAYRNLYHFGNKTNNTPGWVVGDFFVPIVNIFAPYKNMKELYEKTLGNNQSKLVLGWWLTFLMASFVGRYVDFLSKNQSPTDAEVTNMIGIVIVGILIEVAALILAVMLCKKITDAQTQKAKKY